MLIFKQIYEKSLKQNSGLSETEFLDIFMKEMNAQLPYVKFKNTQKFTNKIF